MVIKWHFPPTNGGVKFGLNDSGLEIFQADAWAHTIREIIQNSLDAANDRNNDQPVIVEMSEKIIPASEIGASDLKVHMSKVLELAKEQKSSKWISFYENALKTLNQNEIKILAIVDSHTTGLVNEKWNALIHDEGTSRKEGMSAAGGNFGIGKNAPYGISALKTLCYSTRYLDKGRTEKFIARCKIASHENPNNSNEILQHIGFGTKSKFQLNTTAMPTEGKEIYEEFRLAESGSGIFIIGFDPKIKDWIKVAKKSIAQNFFVAIHEQKLKVIIDSEEVTNETLDSIFENELQNDPTRHYYHIIRDAKSIEKTIKDEIGSFTLRLAIDNDDFSNQIAYINRRGMLITDERSFKKNPFYHTIGRGWAKYMAVVTANNDDTDMEIRKIEPPNHQTIEYKRINDEEKRDSTYTKLHKIEKQITAFITSELSQNIHNHDFVLEDLAEILPFPNDSGIDETETQNGELTTHEREPSLDPPNTAVGIVGGGGGPFTIPGGGSGVHQSKTDKKGRKVSSQGSTIFNRQRIVRNKNRLSVAFTSQQKDRKEICFAIRPVGEERKNETIIPITLDQEKPSSYSINIKNNQVTITPKPDERVQLDLQISETNEYTGYELVEIIPHSKNGAEK